MVISGIEKVKQEMGLWVWAEVYIVNKMMRELSPRGCLREPARWIFGRTALEADGTARATFRGGSSLASSGSSKDRRLWSGLSQASNHWRWGQRADQRPDGAGPFRHSKDMSFYLKWGRSHWKCWAKERHCLHVLTGWLRLLCGEIMSRGRILCEHVRTCVCFLSQQ